VSTRDNGKDELERVTTLMRLRVRRQREALKDLLLRVRQPLQVDGLDLGVAERSRQVVVELPQEPPGTLQFPLVPGELLRRTDFLDGPLLRFRRRQPVLGRRLPPHQPRGKAMCFGERHDAELRVVLAFPEEPRTDGFPVVLLPQLDLFVRGE
jgi:hypothetical protein